MKTFSVDEVKEHNSSESCWVIRRNRVYDVTRFINNHPGGANTIQEFGGEDVTLLMNTMDSHIHSKNAYRTLADMQIGILEGHENDPKIDVAEVEPVDWSKPMLPQVAKLGAKYSHWVHIPIDRWVRLSENNIAEALTRSPWYLVPMFWIPIIFYNLVKGYNILKEHPTILVAGAEFSYGIWAIPALFIFGFCNWPFIEYFMHRFLFHMEPPADNSWLISLHFAMHGQHHKAPFDPYHLVFPPLPAAVFGVLFYSAYSSLLPENIINICFAGGILGYMCYDLTHYYIHHGQPEPDSYFGKLKKWHIRHHYVDHENGFGVSSNFLDYVFGTDFQRYSSGNK